MNALFAALILAAAPAAQQSRPLTPSDAPARELSDDQVQSQVQAFLGSIDTPISSEQWRALGPRAATMLEGIAQDHERLPTRRARALEGLSFVGSAGAPDLMLSMAKDQAEPPIVRMSAMRGAGRLVEPVKLAAALKPILLSDASPHVRAQAAEVLAHRAPGAGCAALAEQLKREQPDQRAAFHRAAKACNLDQ